MSEAVHRKILARLALPVLLLLQVPHAGVLPIGGQERDVAATFDDMADTLPRWAAMLYEDLLRHARLGWPPGLSGDDEHEEGGE